MQDLLKEPEIEGHRGRCRSVGGLHPKFKSKTLKTLNPKPYKPYKPQAPKAPLRRRTIFLGLQGFGVEAYVGSSLNSGPF